MSSVFRNFFWSRDLEIVNEKNHKRSKFQKCLKSFPSVQTCLGAIFLEKFFCSLFHGFIESFRKNQKKFKIPKMPKIDPKLSKRVLNMLYGNFSDFVCPVIHAGLFRFSGLKNMSSVFRNNTQQRFFLHSRHSQYTQTHFRFSGLIIMSSDSPN